MNNTKAAKLGQRLVSVERRRCHAHGHAHGLAGNSVWMGSDSWRGIDATYGCLLIGWSKGPTYKWVPTSGRSIKLVRVEVDFTSRLEVETNIDGANQHSIY